MAEFEPRLTTDIWVSALIRRAESGRAHSLISPTAVDISARGIALLRDRTQANVLTIAGEGEAAE